MTAQCQAQHGLRADRFQAYFLARKVRRNYFPHVSTVMWPTPPLWYEKGHRGFVIFIVHCPLSSSGVPPQGDRILSCPGEHRQ